MTKNYEMAAKIVIYFFDEFYRDGVVYAKQSISENLQVRTIWNHVKRAIQNRSFASGEPLMLIHRVANLPLEENTDDEAYVWLEKMVTNIERDDGIIDEY